MIKRNHASCGRLREVIYGNTGLLEATVDTIVDCRLELAEKIGFVPVFIMQQKTERFIPRFDLYEDEDAFHVVIEVPGIDVTDLNVYVTDVRIRITGKRSRCANSGKTIFLEQLDGHFSRTLHLDGPVEADNCKAILSQGLLRVTLPRAVTKALEAGEIDIPVEER